MEKKSKQGPSQQKNHPLRFIEDSAMVALRSASVAADSSVLAASSGGQPVQLLTISDTRRRREEGSERKRGHERKFMGNDERLAYNDSVR